MEVKMVKHISHQPPTQTTAISRERFINNVLIISIFLPRQCHIRACGTSVCVRALSFKHLWCVCVCAYSANEKFVIELNMLAHQIV